MYINMPKVIEVLREEYKNWASSLSEEERKAIRKYSYNSHDTKPNRFFERLNSMLRGVYNKNDVYRLEYYANVISAALNKHPLTHDIVCYRGMDNNIVKGIKIGTVFEIDQFVSTSVVKSKALNKKYKYIIYSPVGTNGAYIESVSAFPKQREFLINKNVRFKLLSIEGTIIRLEVQV